MAKVTTRHSILFRCDGSSELGFGHVFRCLALADELKDNHDCDVVFAVLQENKAVELIKNHTYHVETTDYARKDFVYGDWLNSIVHKNSPYAFIFDVRDDLPLETLSRFREKGILIVTIDDPTDRRLLADLVFYPPVSQVKAMNWEGFTGQLYVGWEWVVLRREFSQNRKNSIKRINEASKSKILNILVTMGGSDPKGMTLKAIKALIDVDNQFEATIILGPGFVHRERLNELLKNFPHSYRIYENISNIAGIMAESDLAVASFGVTAYELAAIGVPAIHLCLTEDHVQSASSFHDNGMALSLGLEDHVLPDKMAASIQHFINDENLRLRMAHQSKTSVDGRGAIRIAQLVASKLEKGGYLHEPQMGHS
jgi:UDP-2,4-diacetamido-2,4,6-trideoxy-beta-L-altropyranose hydrolase